MPAPMPLRKFKALVEANGCTIEQTTKEWCVRNAAGKYVMGFAVTHPKQEVKFPYVQKFKKLMGIQ